MFQRIPIVHTLGQYANRRNEGGIVSTAKPRAFLVGAEYIAGRVSRCSTYSGVQSDVSVLLNTCVLAGSKCRDAEASLRTFRRGTQEEKSLRSELCNAAGVVSLKVTFPVWNLSVQVLK